MNNTAVPPRFVPTLTDVVHPVELISPQQPNNAVEHNPLQLEDRIVRRVMQRVDLVLEGLLREAVSQVILLQTQALGPHLREEIELVVRQSVSQAMAQELTQNS